VDAFDDRGWFWLPDSPGGHNRVTGTFSFDGDQIRLELDDSLAGAEVKDDVGSDAEEVEIETGVVEQTHSVIHGHLKEHGDVTVLNATGRNLYGFLSAGTPETWTSWTALLGTHSDGSKFERATFSFDLLAAWTDPPALTRRVNDQQFLDVEVRELERACVGDVTVTLLSGWNGSYGTRKVDVQRRCWIRLEAATFTANEVLSDWVMPIQDLLIALLGRSVRISTVILGQEGAPIHETNSMVFGGLRTGEPADIESIHLQGWGAPTVFTRHELPLSFNDLINGWMATWRKHRSAIVQSQSSFHAPFMYTESTYAARFLGMEQLARKLHPGSQVPAPEHRERVAAMIDAAVAAGVEDAVVEWATRVLTNANNVPPRELIEKLLTDEPGLFDRLLEVEPAFAQRATMARNGVAHPGASKALTVARRHWFGEVLLMLVRVRLLIESGAPRANVHAAVSKRGTLQHAVTELAKDDL
jgi:hypothetical protein